MGPRYRRPTTAAEERTAARNAQWIEMLDTRIANNEAQSLENRELLIEVAGRDGHGGQIRTLRDSAKSQGERIGKLEGVVTNTKHELSTLTLKTKMGLAAVAAVAGGGTSAIIQALFGG